MFFDLMHIIYIICIIYINLNSFPRYGVISCTHWWEAEGSMGGVTPWITARSIRKTLASWAITPSVLPDKFARFLFEYHSHHFESLDLPELPADRSDFDVHGALLDDKVQDKWHTLRFNKSCPLLCLNNLLSVL